MKDRFMYGVAHLEENEDRVMKLEALLRSTNLLYLNTFLAKGWQFNKLLADSCIVWLSLQKVKYTLGANRITTSVVMELKVLRILTSLRKYNSFLNVKSDRLLVVSSIVQQSLPRTKFFLGVMVFTGDLEMAKPTLKDFPSVFLFRNRNINMEFWVIRTLLTIIHRKVKFQVEARIHLT